MFKWDQNKDIFVTKTHEWFSFKEILAFELFCPKKLDNLLSTFFGPARANNLIKRDQSWRIKLFQLKLIALSWPRIDPTKPSALDKLVRLALTNISIQDKYLWLHHTLFAPLK
jgi:hypothetical protein